MSNTALDEVEAAIAETTKARQYVSGRVKSKQVKSPEDKDRLKSVAYAWFQNHKPDIQGHPSRPDCTDADDAFRRVIQATGKNAARNTYAQALKSANGALEIIRTTIATSPVDAPAAASCGDSSNPSGFQQACARRTNAGDPRTSMARDTGVCIHRRSYGGDRDDGRPS